MNPATGEVRVAELFVAVLGLPTTPMRPSRRLMDDVLVSGELRVRMEIPTESGEGLSARVITRASGLE